MMGYFPGRRVVSNAPSGGGALSSLTYNYVQKASESLSTTAQTSVTTAAWSVGSKTSGNAVAWWVFYVSGASKTISSWTGGDGITMTQVGSLFDAGTTTGVLWGYAANIPAGTGTITANFSAAVDFPAILCAEYSGFSTSAPFVSGEIASNVQVNPSTTADAVTSTNTPALSGTSEMALIGLSVDRNGVVIPDAGTGFTSRLTTWTFGSNGDTSGSATTRLEDKKLTSLAAVAATFTKASGTDTYATVAMVLR